MRIESETDRIVHALGDDHRSLQRRPMDLRQQHLQTLLQSPPFLASFPILRVPILLRRLLVDYFDSSLQFDKHGESKRCPGELKSRETSSHDVDPFSFEGSGQSVGGSGGGRENEGDTRFEDDEEGVEIVERVEEFREISFVQRMSTTVSCGDGSATVIDRGGCTYYQ